MSSLGKNITVYIEDKVYKAELYGRPNSLLIKMDSNDIFYFLDWIEENRYFNKNKSCKTFTFESDRRKGILYNCTPYENYDGDIVILFDNWIETKKKNVLEGTFEKIEKSNKSIYSAESYQQILIDEFTKFATKTYPGRIYGMYKWNSNKEEWEIDKDFCKKYNINYE